jgi:hypothetical protein
MWGEQVPHGWVIGDDELGRHAVPPRAASAWRTLCAGGILQHDDSRPGGAVAIDFALISRTGLRRPKIHEAGRIFRSDTYNTPGIAVHCEPDFWQQLSAVTHVLEGLPVHTSPEREIDTRWSR